MEHPNNLPNNLSGLDEHDWNVVRNTWARFTGDHYITKLNGSQGWQVEAPFAPFVYKTEVGARDFVDAQLLEESRSRAVEARRMGN